ncbi:hypothetical protein [Kribbella deserti]|uniref:DUF4157 domain-containing protein n=1 Tax=Kribbella deserti TaxID=1926257 RepID=A0ABV6QHS4_9ACTN
MASPNLASVVGFGDNRIVIAAGLNDGEAVAMLAHELAHVVMHTAYMTGPGPREPDFDVVAEWDSSTD